MANPTTKAPTAAQMTAPTGEDTTAATLFEQGNELGAGLNDAEGTIDDTDEDDGFVVDEETGERIKLSQSAMNEIHAGRKTVARHEEMAALARERSVED
jgi:hypothetical protein